MSLSLADIKRAKVQAFRDVADGLDAMAGANRDMKRGVEQLPIMGDGWKGVSGDAAHHEIDAHGKYLDGHAQAQQGAAAKIRRAADEFEGVQQLLKKIENDATSGKFTINYDTGEVTPPNGKYDKNELDYLTNTLRQIRAAGEAANTDLEAAVKAAQSLPDPSGAAAQALPLAPGSAIKPNGSLGALQNVAGAPNPDGDPGATKAAAAAVGGDAQANYKEWYPKTTTPDKGSLAGNLGGLGITEPRSSAEQPPRPADPRTAPAPKLDPNTPQGKAAIDKFRSILATQYPPDQVEAKLSEAIKGAQQDRPMVATPEPGSPERARESFSEAFHNSWDRGVKGVQDMVGANGLEEFKDAWGDAGTGLKNSFGELAHPTEMSPERIDNAHRLIDNPKAFLGEQSAIAAQAIPGLILGGEGAAVRAGLPAELVTEGGAPASVMRGLDPSGGMSWKDFDSQYGSAGARNWPSNDGFPPGYVPGPAHLPAGTILDRFGGETGSYLAPDGAHFADRALMPESVGSQYHRYMITGEPLPPGLRIVEGPVAPWFGQTPSPGATQYMIVGSDGATPSVEELIRRGYLTEDGPPLGR